MVQLVQAIRDGLSDPDPESSISSVKNAVAVGLRGVDPSVRVRKTDYFNHTLAPDLVMA
jgi:hypothetical protein